MFKKLPSGAEKDIVFEEVQKKIFLLEGAGKERLKVDPGSVVYFSDTIV